MESLAEVEYIDLGIRGIQRRLRGARYQSILTAVIGRLLAIGAITWMIIQLFSLIDNSKLPKNHMITTFTLYILFFEMVAMIFFTLPFLIFLAFAPTDGAAILFTLRAFINVDLFNNVQAPSPMTTALFDVSGGLDVKSFLFSPFGYYFTNLRPFKEANRATTLILSFILLGITILSFLFKADMRSAAATFVISQFIVLYGNVQLMFVEVFTFSPTRNLGVLLGSKIVQVALASYLFLEIALQISYVNQILDPTRNRQKRVLRALDRLKEFRLGVGVAQPVAKEEAKKEETEGMEGEEKEATKTIVSTGSTLARKFGLAGITYFIEKASDSLFAKPGGQQEKLTARLQRYHDSLVHSDPTVDDKLVGTSVAVSPFMAIVYVLVSVVFRVGIMIFGLFAIMNPDILLFVLRYPPSIYNSLEMYEPEGVVLLLIPIVVFILLITALIGYIQERIAKRLEKGIEPVIEEEVQYTEEERPGIITEGGVSPITEEDFYRQLAEEVGMTEDEL